MVNAVEAFVDGEVEQIVRLIKGEISNLAEFGLDGLTLFTLHTYRCISRAIQKASGPLGMTESESLVKMLLALGFLHSARIRVGDISKGSICQGIIEN
jgi:hypothetical protein